MIACVDVDYRQDQALAAAVLFHGWTDATGCAELTQGVAAVQPYQPGQFFQRELPCLLAVLGRVARTLEVVVIRRDGTEFLEERAKLVRPDFIQSIGRHWRQKQIEWNAVVSG